MNGKTSHWLLVLLGLIVIAAATYCYLNEFKEYCVAALFPETFGVTSLLSVEEQALQKCHLFNDLLLVLGSLLLTGLLFYLAGRCLGKNSNANENTFDESEELAECRKAYDELLVKSSGGKIEKSSKRKAITKSKVEESNNIEVETESVVVNQAQTLGVFNAQNAKMVFGKKIEENDLKIIEGIGPKIASILNEKGINTWVELAQSNTEKIKEYLIEKGGAAYKIHEPDTWPQQSKLASEGKFEELKKLQENLKGGKKA